MLVAIPGLDVESIMLLTDVAAAVADAAAAVAAAVEVAEVDLKPEVDPKVVGATADEFPLFPPVEPDVLLLTMPVAKEFKLAKFVFPMSRWFAMAANWLFGS